MSDGGWSYRGQSGDGRGFYGILREKLTNNCFYEYFEDFRYSILSFLKNIDNYKEDLKTLLTFMFQKLDYSTTNFVK